MYARVVRGRKRIGQYDDAYPFPDERSEEIHTFALRDEVRRYDDDLFGGRRDHLYKPLGYVANLPANEPAHPVRMIEHQLGLRRDPRQDAIDEIADQVLVETAYHRAVPVFLEMALPGLDCFIECLVWNVLVEDVDRYRLLGVPVFVEAGGDVIDNRAYGGDILV